MLSALISAISANIIYFILHIQNTSSFPKPLNHKEEKEMLERMKNGDKSARAVLIERNLRLVSHIVKKYYSKTNDNDDLISIGTIGLIKAIDSFDSDKCVRLATYASRCIENELLMHFRAGKKQSNDIYLSDALEIDKDGNPLTIEDTISSPIDLAEDLETKMRWEKVAKVIKNIDAIEYTDADNIKQILANHVINPVKFKESIENMISQGVDTIIEIGPGKVLSGFVKKTNKEIKIYNTNNIEAFEQILDDNLKK